MWTIPNQIASINRRSLSFGVGHVDPNFSRGVIPEKSVIDTWESGSLQASVAAGKGLKTEAVSELMQQNGNEIDSGAMIIVEPEIPEPVR